MRSYYLMALMLFVSVASYGQFGSCTAPNTAEIIISVLADNYPNESSWTLNDANGTPLATRTTGFTANQMRNDTVCVPASACLTFTMRDSYGDGICCQFGQGSYTVRRNGVEVATGGDFDFTSAHNFNCPPGSTCDNASVINTGTFNANFSTTWYAFTPSQNGMYKLSTCNLINMCDTKIWVYDECPTVLHDNNMGALAYNDDFCGSLSEVVAALEANKTYYVRIGSGAAGCATISWTLSYEGPIVGCTDPTSCTYNPLATVSDPTACLPMGDPGCPDGPDLVVLQDVLRNSINVGFLADPDQCLIGEGCIRGYGAREIIRFTTHIKNIGARDYYIGQPPANGQPNNSQFTYDICHNHWHYDSYAEYMLVDQNNHLVPVGKKVGFCVLDLECNDGGDGKYTCGNMGISNQCGDIYGSGLQCQWIDVTDVPDGDYKLLLRVNWQGDADVLGWYETSYENNWAHACINIDRTSGQLVATVNNQGCTPYVDCAGVENGLAVSDCEGTCNGNRVTGDLDLNQTRNNIDIQGYIQNSIGVSPPGTINACNDLNADGVINVVDAGLLVDCVLHGPGAQPVTHTHRSCEFPFNVTNETQFTELSIANLNQVNKTFDIMIRNPLNKVLGYQFNISGVRITGVENRIMGSFDGQLSFNAATGEVLGLSMQEIPIEKNLNPVALVRVSYSDVLSDEICIADIKAVINEAYEQTLRTLGNQCEDIVFVGTNNIAASTINVSVQPNPFATKTTITFDNPKHEAYRLDITDVNGRVVRSFDELTGNSVTIDRKNLAAAMYFYRLHTKQGIIVGKIVAE